MSCIAFFSYRFTLIEQIVAAKLHILRRISKYFANFLGELYGVCANFLGELYGVSANFLGELCVLIRHSLSLQYGESGREDRGNGERLPFSEGVWPYLRVSQRPPKTFTAAAKNIYSDRENHSQRPPKTFTATATTKHIVV